MRLDWPHVRVGLALLLVLAFTAAALAAPINYRALGAYGYVGVFLVTLLATAALVFPVPYLGVIVVAGTFLNPIAVAVVGGVAAAIGELTGYLLGITGRSLLPENRWIVLTERAMGRFGVLVVLVAAALPNPFFDAVGIIAGATRLPIWSFLLFCFIGKTLRFALLAVIGAALPL